MRECTLTVVKDRVEIFVLVLIHKLVLCSCRTQVREKLSVVLHI